MHPWRSLTSRASKLRHVHSSWRVQMLVPGTQRFLSATPLSDTPAMRQYWAVKRDPQYSGCVVLFQLGGFYEAFYSDAATLARVCGIVLTARGSTPMAGLPVDKVDAHVLKLLRLGHRVVLVDQEGPVGLNPNPFRHGSFARAAVQAGAKQGLISRAANRVLTPGTSADLLGASHVCNHYLASIALDYPAFTAVEGATGSGKDGQEVAEVNMPSALAWADVSTGELYVRQCADARALGDELSAISPAELLLPSTVPHVNLVIAGEDTEVETNSSGTMSLELAVRLLKPEQCRLLHDVHDQRRSVDHALRKVIVSAVQADPRPPHPPLRLPGPELTEGGCWLTFLPERAYSGRAAHAMLGRLAQQHGLGGAHGKSALTPLESRAAGGLLRYLLWAYCGSLPRLSLPVSLTAASEGLPPGLSPRDVHVHSEAAVAEGLPQPSSIAETLGATGMNTGSTPPHAFIVPPRLFLNEASQRALELVRPMLGRRRGRGSLLDLIDLAKTHGGSRLLDSRLVRPLASLTPLLHRHDAVAALAGDRASREGRLRTALRDRAMLGAVPDLERCFQRLSNGTARAGSAFASSLARDLTTVRDGVTAARLVGVLLSTGDPVPLLSCIGSVPPSVALLARSTAVASACKALQCEPRNLYPSLLQSVATEFDVIWDEEKAEGGGVHSAHTATSPLNRSYVLAQCAAVLTVPLEMQQEEGVSASMPQGRDAFSALASAQSMLVDALTSNGRGSSGDAAPALAAAGEGNNAPEDGASSFEIDRPLSPSSFFVRVGYNADLDSARIRAANTAVLRRELEALLREHMGFPPLAKALRIRGGLGDTLSRSMGGRERDGLYVEIDARARPNRALLDAFLAQQDAAAAAARAARTAAASVGVSPPTAAASPFSSLRPTDFVLRPIRSTETLKRFRCEALDRLETEAAEAGARAEALELRVLNQLAQAVLSSEDAVKAVARAVAVTDTVAALAELADRHALVRPVLTEVGLPVRVTGVAGTPSTVSSPPVHDVGCGELMLRDARHLVVEHALHVWHPTEDGAVEIIQGGADKTAIDSEDARGVDLSANASAYMGLERDPQQASTEHPRSTTFIANDIVLGAPRSALHGLWTTPLSAAATGASMPGGWEATNSSSALPAYLADQLAAARCMLLVGPNMGGKSTYLRTAAQAVVLAQMGSFVPASAARMGIVDAIFCRVGASDDLAGHRSTFRVEMEEMSDILRAATKDSLVVVDEVGRGTAVADGLALSTAVLAELCDNIRCRTLFATHFPELAAAALPSMQAGPSHSAATPPTVRAMYMEWVHAAGSDIYSGSDGGESVEDRQYEGRVLVTHRVKLHPVHAAAAAGQPASHLVRLLGTSVSHGLSVATHAGLPPRVLKRARAIMHRLQQADLPATWAKAAMAAAHEGQ